MHINILLILIVFLIQSASLIGAEDAVVDDPTKAVRETFIKAINNNDAKLLDSCLASQFTFSAGEGSERKIAAESAMAYWRKLNMLAVITNTLQTTKPMAKDGEPAQGMPLRKYIIYPSDFQTNTSKKICMIAFGEENGQWKLSIVLEPGL